MSDINIYGGELNIQCQEAVNCFGIYAENSCNITIENAQLVVNTADSTERSMGIRSSDSIIVENSSIFCKCGKANGGGYNGTKGSYPIYAANSVNILNSDFSLFSSNKNPIAIKVGTDINIDNTTLDSLTLAQGNSNKPFVSLHEYNISYEWQKDEESDNYSCKAILASTKSPAVYDEVYLAVVSMVNNGDLIATGKYKEKSLYDCVLWHWIYNGVDLPQAYIIIGTGGEEIPAYVSEYNGKFKAYYDNNGVIFSSEYSLPAPLDGYSLTVINGSVISENNSMSGYAFNEPVTIRANESGENFTGWYMTVPEENVSVNVLVSTDPEYTLYMKENTEITAMYSTGIERMGTLRLKIDSNRLTDSSAVYTVDWIAPRGCALKEVGILYIFGDTKPDTLEPYDSTTKKRSSVFRDQSGTVTFTSYILSEENKDKNCYVCGYMIYDDEEVLDGETIIYTSIKTVTP
ncbi:MAG: hypothetical protein K6G68_11720 [Oscillospiraceae bacterium]|nr:hypothetical protein [Oscillospiraceae bacterium]